VGRLKWKKGINGVWGTRCEHDAAREFSAKKNQIIVLVAEIDVFLGGKLDFDTFRDKEYATLLFWVNKSHTVTGRSQGHGFEQHIRSHTFKIQCRHPSKLQLPFPFPESNRVGKSPRSP